MLNLEQNYLDLTITQWGTKTRNARGGFVAITKKFIQTQKCIFGPKNFQIGLLLNIFKSIIVVHLKTQQEKTKQAVAFTVAGIFSKANTHLKTFGWFTGEKQSTGLD